MAYTEIIDDGDQVILRSQNFEATYKKNICYVYWEKYRNRVLFVAERDKVNKDYIVYTLAQANEWGFGTIEDLYNYLVNILAISGGGGIPYPPSDGELYGMKDEEWTIIPNNIDIPNITLQPTFAGFKFINEDVYSIYIEGANFETSNLSDYNIGIGVEVHRANVLDACGNSQGVVFYYTLGDNLCEEGYSSGGEVCVPNFHSEDDMIDYIYYNNDSCIETIEWTGTQIGSKFINDFGFNANVFIFNCQKLTSVNLEYVTEMSDSHVYIFNPLLIEISTPLLASVGGGNDISFNTSLTTINQPLLASVGRDNYINGNTSLTTIIVAPTLTFTNLNNNNQILAWYNNNALNQTTVDAICDAILAGSTLIPIDGAYLDFSGGTNAIPGGTRITDLQNAGWTVTTN